MWRSSKADTLGLVGSPSLALGQVSGNWSTWYRSPRHRLYSDGSCLSCQTWHTDISHLVSQPGRTILTSYYSCYSSQYQRLVSSKPGPPGPPPTARARPPGRCSPPTPSRISPSSSPATAGLRSESPASSGPEECPSENGQTGVKINPTNYKNPEL